MVVLLNRIVFEGIPANGNKTNALITPWFKNEQIHSAQQFHSTQLLVVNEVLRTPPPAVYYNAAEILSK